MTEPLVAARRGRAAMAKRIWLLRFTSRTSRQVSSSNSASGRAMPAAFTSTSRLSRAATKSRIAWRSRTSTRAKRMPSLAGSAPAAASLASELPMAVTEAPRRAKPCAIARPMPLEPPVTRTARPA